VLQVHTPFRLAASGPGESPQIGDEQKALLDDVAPIRGEYLSTTCLVAPQIADTRIQVLNDKPEREHSDQQPTKSGREID
jgi:hypothetical protein